MIEHEVTPTIEQFRGRVLALETALTVANVYLEHWKSAQPGRCPVECPKCHAEAVLGVR